MESGNRSLRDRIESIGQLLEQIEKLLDEIEERKNKMIKSKYGKVKMEGSFVQLSTDLTCILKSFRRIVDDEKFSFIDMDDFLNHLVEVSGKTNEEISANTEELIKKNSQCAFDEVSAELSDREKELLKKMFGE